MNVTGQPKRPYTVAESLSAGISIDRLPTMVEESLHDGSQQIAARARLKDCYFCVGTANESTHAFVSAVEAAIGERGLS